MLLRAPQVVSKASAFPANVFRQIILELVALAVLSATVVTIQHSRSGETLRLRDVFEAPELGFSADFAGAQFPTSREDRNVGNFNPEAFNQDRNRSIASDTRKLLSLAIALRTELNQKTGTSMAQDAEKKANDIEKLAHKVKEAMQINPNVGPP